MIDIQEIKVDVAKRGHITNSYLVYDDESKEGVLIDPGFEAEKIIKEIVKNEINLRYIILTHAHGDHFGALEEISNFAKCPILVHKLDYDMLIGKVENYSKMQGIPIQDLSKCDILEIDSGYTFKIGTLNFEVIYTPGHTKGGICILEKTSNKLFTGDTIFYDCYGRCDLATASFEDMVNSIQNIFNRFDDIMIYPGHGKSVNIKFAKKYIRILLSMKGVKID